DATNAKAVAKLLELKEYPTDLSFILLVDSTDTIKKYVKHLHPKIETLLVYHQRPLTVVYDRAKNLPAEVVASDGSVAIRIPQDDYCIYLLRAFGKPIVTTTANESTNPLPDCFAEISEDIKKKADFISTRRRKETALNDPSVIVRLSPRTELVFLRE
ncbi:MAG: Sua5/YciO/YrdC/YwlC family protein, partial [Bacteroidota bacterium]